MLNNWNNQEVNGISVKNQFSKRLMENNRCKRGNEDYFYARGLFPLEHYKMCDYKELLTGLSINSTLSILLVNIIWLHTYSSSTESVQFWFFNILTFDYTIYSTYWSYISLFNLLSCAHFASKLIMQLTFLNSSRCSGDIRAVYKGLFI